MYNKAMATQEMPPRQWDIMNSRFDGEMWSHGSTSRPVIPKAHQQMLQVTETT